MPPELAVLALATGRSGISGVRGGITLSNKTDAVVSWTNQFAAPRELAVAVQCSTNEGDQTQKKAAEQRGHPARNALRRKTAP